MTAFAIRMLQLASLVVAASAFNFQPRETAEGPLARVDVPRSAPTAPPKPRWAEADPRQLFGRASLLGTDTCGYLTRSVAGDIVAFTCGSSWTCTNQPGGSFRDCCSGTGCYSSTKFVTTCLDYTAPACAASLTRGSNTLCCTYSTPLLYCITFLYTTSATPGTVFTLYNCDRSAYSGSQYILGAEPPTTSTSTSSTPTSSSTTSTSTPSTTSTAITTTSTEAAVAASSGVPVGPIVGGVVGGVAVLALIGFGIFFILRRQKKRDADAATAVGQQQQQQHPPFPPQMAQHTGGTYQSGPMYDPNYVQYGAGAGGIAPKSPGDYSGPVGSASPQYRDSNYYHHNENNMPGFGR